MSIGAAAPDPPEDRDGGSPPVGGDEPPPPTDSGDDGALTGGGVVPEVPACTTLGPMGKVEVSSSLKKSKVVGSAGVLDMLANGKDDSSNTTC
jgi:hypothetical protein